MTEKERLLENWTSADRRLKDLTATVMLWHSEGILPGGFFLAYCRHPAGNFDVGMRLIRARRVSRKLRIEAEVAAKMIREQADRGFVAVSQKLAASVRGAA